MSSELHLVFGGTGGAGAATVRALLARGHRVRVASRNNANIVAGAEWVAADATDPASLRRAAAGASVIYNCTNAPYTQWASQFPPLWRNITATAAHVGARLIVMDNVYMYGAGAQPLTETSPHLAIGTKGKTRIAMSDELQAAAKHQPIAVGRAADYYGPNVHRAFFPIATFKNALAGKRLNAISNLDLPHSQAFIDDVGLGLAVLGEHPEADGQIWHLPHAPAISQREFLSMLQTYAQRPIKLGLTPSWLIRSLALAVPFLREVREMLYQYEQPFIVDSSKFERTFGVRATSWAEGVRRTFVWMQEHPQLIAAPSH